MAEDNSIWAREQAVAIVVDLRGQAGSGTNTSWKTPGYINGNSTGSGRSYWADGVQNANPQSLINALAAISSSTTKTTKIEMKWEIPGVDFTPGPRGGSSLSYSTYSTMSVFIDWENMVVKWSGQENSGISTYAMFGGKKTISSAGSTVKLDWVPGQNGNGRYKCRDCPVHSQVMVLKTGTNRNITGLPAPVSSNTVTSGGFASQFTLHGNYMVTTDNGIIATATPTPPAETPTETVSGIKISELNAATSLNDTDLFVLSRDQPAGAPYDKSLNVTLENLKKGLNIDKIINLVYDSNYILGPVPSGTWLIHLQGQQNDGDPLYDEDVTLSISRKYTVDEGKYLWFKCSAMSTTFCGVSELYNSTSSAPTSSDPGWLQYTTTSNPKAEPNTSQTRPDNDGIAFIYDGSSIPYCVGFAFKVS